MSETDSDAELFFWLYADASLWEKRAAEAVLSLRSLPCTPEHVEVMFDILVVATVTLEQALEEYDDWIQKGVDADAKWFQRKQRAMRKVPGPAAEKDLVEVEIACTRFLQDMYSKFKSWGDYERYRFLTHFEEVFRLPKGTKDRVLPVKARQVAANPHPWAW